MPVDESIQPMIRNQITRNSQETCLTMLATAANFASDAFPMKGRIGILPGPLYYDFTIGLNVANHPLTETPPSPYLGHVALVFQEMREKEFTIIFNDNVVPAVGQPSVLVQVDTTSNGAPQPDETQHYAKIEFAGFQPDEFPIGITLLGPYEAPSGESDGGTIMLMSNSPLVALDGVKVEFKGEQCSPGPIAVEVMGVGFPGDEPIGRRIRVMLQQAVIDPPHI